MPSPSEPVNPSPSDLDAVVAAMGRLRVARVSLESDLYDPIASLLFTGGVAFLREFRLGPGCRIDFLTKFGTGIEVKKGKVNSREISGQLERYAAFESVKAIVLVVERSVFMAPTIANGKPVVYVALNRLRGVAL